MIVVPPPHPHRARLLGTLLAASLALAACKGAAGERRTTTRTTSGGGVAGDQDTPGEVVIAPPAGRYVARAVASPGTVSGTVTTSATPAPEAPIAAGRDAAVCGATIVDTTVHSRGTGVANAVVWLDGVRTGKPIPLEKRVELESDRCILVPRVQAAYTGGAVNVLGHDDFRQHLRFAAAGESAPRAVVLLGKDEQVIPTEQPLARPGLVVVRDTDHPWPHAFVAVFDHPYFAVTKPDGSFTIDQVPPGAYRLDVWHEGGTRTEQPVTVTANGTVRVEVKVE